MSDTQDKTPIFDKSELPFEATISLEALAAQQGVAPVTDPTVLLGDFWPQEESTEEFLQTLRGWRHDDNKHEVR